MRLRGTDTDEEAGVLMAPLIDCVFILLIFFLVTSFLQKPHKDLGIVLPQATAAVKTTAHYTTIIIEVTAGRPPRGEPVIVVDGEEMTQTLLHRRLRELAVKDPARSVRVDADREVDARYVVRILDMLQFEGLNNVGIRTMD